MFPPNPVQEELREPPDLSSWPGCWCPSRTWPPGATGVKGQLLKQVFAQQEEHLSPAPGRTLQYVEPTDRRVSKGECDTMVNKIKNPQKGSPLLKLLTCSINSALTLGSLSLAKSSTTLKTLTTSPARLSSLSSSTCLRVSKTVLATICLLNMFSLSAYFSNFSTGLNPSSWNHSYSYSWTPLSIG